MGTSAIFLVGMGVIKRRIMNRLKIKIIIFLMPVFTGAFSQDFGVPDLVIPEENDSYLEGELI